MIEVTAYTDGSSNAMDRSGGWGVVLMFGGATKELSGSATDTTNNRMELTAILKAVEAITKPCRLTVYTDSNDCIGWIRGTFRCRHVALNTLCYAINAAVQAKGIELVLKKVDGHSNDYYNDRADLLASMARHNMLDNKREVENGKLG